ncbi:hypothetical protein K491DRAFT_678015 [Lophiostoma macrostomum CBS 122681]|uniref:Uncharacterized protein n=1 Tax=Lophiostoma macrostomum CBS 122681 TaxID=1314788 RepID=A0A6A6TA83_9PLEO|nr:hypothetical protein K491DRAFT_678015 [Lophiostoma macrostomum CBS 122681]
MPPRRLPWVDKGGANKPKVKDSPKPGKNNIYKGLDSDEDFFEGTILASSRKGKERAGRSKMRQRSDRAQSSSPPPMAELPPPQTEYMRKAVDKFNLRDDEWMMVEDEFLQTAKLFTRHLHLAEYELLKENIQKKKEEIARSVVPTEKPSDERQIQMRIEAQTKKQKKMLQGIFSSSGKEDIDNYLGPSRHTTSDPPHRKPSTPNISSTKPAVSKSANATLDSDSDDLDAPKPPPRPIQRNSSQSTTTFAKPDLPPRSRAALGQRPRTTPFDLLDELASKRPSSPTKGTQTSSIRSSSPTKPHQSSQRRSPSPIRPNPASTQRTSSSTKPSQASTARPGRAFSLFDELDKPTLAPTVSKEQADSFAKRKAEREKDKEREREKRKSVKLDDIPTFLF